MMRTAARLGGGLVILLAGTGCRPGAASAPPLRIGCETWMQRPMQAAAKAFAAAAPGRRVEVLFVPTSNVLAHADERFLLSRIDGDGAPDVIVGSAALMATLAREGWLEAMPAAVRRDLAGHQTGYPPGLVETLNPDGRLRVMPFTLAPELLYINRALFRARGVPLPGPGWSWRDVRAAARRLTRRDPSGRLLQVGYEEFGSLFNLIVRSGARVLDEPGHPRRLSLRDPRLNQTFQFVDDLVTLDRSAPVSPKEMEHLGESPQLRFARGRVGMLYGGLWIGNFAAENAKGLDWLAMPFPGPAGEPADVPCTAFGFGVRDRGAARSLAWEFVRFAAGPPGELRLTGFLAGDTPHAGGVWAAVRAQAAFEPHWEHWRGFNEMVWAPGLVGSADPAADRLDHLRAYEYVGTRRYFPASFYAPPPGPGEGRDSPENVRNEYARIVALAALHEVPEEIHREAAAFLARHPGDPRSGWVERLDLLALEEISATPGEVVGAWTVAGSFSWNPSTRVPMDFREAEASGSSRWKPARAATDGFTTLVSRGGTTGPQRGYGRTRLGSPRRQAVVLTFEFDHAAVARLRGPDGKTGTNEWYVPHDPLRARRVVPVVLEKGITTLELAVGGDAGPPTIRVRVRSFAPLALLGP